MKKILKNLLISCAIFALCALGTSGGYCATAVQSSSALNASDIEQGVMENIRPQNIQGSDIKALEESLKSALSETLPGAKLLSFKEIEKDGVKLIECKVSYNNDVISLTINPQTGALTGKMQDENGNDKINAPVKMNKAAVVLTTAEVNNILRSAIPGASVSRTKYNKKDNTIEGSVNYKNFKYAFKINASTGEIIKMEPVFD